jgi:transposase
MEHIGMDVHKAESQICIWTDEETILERRVRTSPERLTAVLGNRPTARVLIEASTESEWVARCLEQLGHEVIVADPNYAPMYATRNRRIKTDRRDARALMDACCQGTYRPAHRLSDAQQRVRARLAARDNLVRVRVRLIGVMRALLRRQGLRVSSGTARTFGVRVRALEKPEWLRDVLEPLQAVLEAVDGQIERADRAIRELVAEDPVVQRLCTAPGIGPVTAVAFVATLDDVRRFSSARQVRSYLGIVPSENSSAERQHRGAITKSGNDRMRWLLVEAGWCVMRSTRAQAEPLRRWATRIAGRRGRRIAVVALARRLAGILYAMWRDQCDFDPRSIRRGSGETMVGTA